MSWLRTTKREGEKLSNRWRRLFQRRMPFPWEVNKSRVLLYEVSKNAYACQWIAALLEIDCDPGESAADYVSQMLRQPALDYSQELHKRDLALIAKGFADQQAKPAAE